MIRTLLLTATLLLVGTPESEASTSRRRSARPSLAQVCKKRVRVPAGRIFIYKQSAPLRNARGALVGFRKEPTLIMNRNVSRRGTTNIYDSQGRTIGRCPWASAHGHAGGRYRCTMQTSALRRTALKNTRSPKIFFQLTPSTCAEVPDAGRCYGSVKGLCNQLIK